MDGWTTNKQNTQDELEHTLKGTVENTDALLATTYGE